MLREYGVRFVKQVWPGDTLTAKGRVTSVETEGGEGVVHIDLETTNQNGEAVVKGSAVAALPAQV